MFAPCKVLVATTALATRMTAMVVSWHFARNLFTARKHWIVSLLLLLLISAQQVFCENLSATKIVWWGYDLFAYSDHRNGVIQFDDEVFSDIVGIAAGPRQGLALTKEGAVVAFSTYVNGRNVVPAGLSNVVSISVDFSSSWAIKRDVTVARWGTEYDDSNIVGCLSNITAIAWAGGRSYLALRKDGTLLGFRLGETLPYGAPASLAIHPVTLGGQAFSNVVAVASLNGAPLVLKQNGTVFSLKYPVPDTGEDIVAQVDEILIVDAKSNLGNGQFYPSPFSDNKFGPRALSNVVAITGGDHALALKSDGRVVAWGGEQRDLLIPEGLSNVTAIATGEHRSLALKSDGTVVAWGNGFLGEVSVPTGLSNVVAIAAGGHLSLALTTSNAPASVFIPPHGHLEERESEADLIFKGLVISSKESSDASLSRWGKTAATRFTLISVLKGNVNTNELVFWHITSGPWIGGGGGGGGHKFEAGKSYLVFAARMDKPGRFNYVPFDATNRPNEFRQLYIGGVMRTLDSRPIGPPGVKDTHWNELALLLNDSAPANQLYAIDTLDCMSLAGRDDDKQSRSDDYWRQAVLSALVPLFTNDTEKVANRAIRCFETQSRAAIRLSPFTPALVETANKSPFVSCRLGAIRALSGLAGEAVSNSLARLLKNPDQNIRAEAVRLLPRISGQFAEQALRAAAEDESATVRAAVSDVIGDEKLIPLLPTLINLFHEPMGRDPMTVAYLRADERLYNPCDVYTSAGFALVKFDTDQVAAILKTNLDDSGFHIIFLSKLAEKNPEPWLPNLMAVLEERIKNVDERSKNPPLEFNPLGDKILVGAYLKCWEDIRQYLFKQPAEKLASGEMDPYMDLLEKAIRPVPGCPSCGVQEARSLYELYWTRRGMAKRVGDLRQQYDNTDRRWFDQYNREH